MELTPTTILKDRYKIKEKIASGGMGSVYLAHDTALDTLVAIKVNLNTGEHSSRQFLREAKLLAGLRHHNLPRVTDHFVIDVAQYLVMDYIPGDDLSEILASKGPQPIDLVLDWGEQLSEALTYLHTQDPAVIHRDIKPSNLKKTSQGQLILVDFGIAKSSDRGSTTTGVRGLTPGYAPPEQYGSGSTSPASDQYALAATLYTLLLGQEPAEAVERMLGKERLKSPKELDSSIPDQVDAAIQRALEIKPEDRFPNVADFYTALTNPTYAYQAATIPSGSSAQPTLILTSKRSKSPLFIGLFIVIGVVAAGAYLLFPTGIGRNGDDQITSGQSTLSAELTLAAAAAVPSAFLTASPMPSTNTPEVAITPSPVPTTIGAGALIAYVSNRGDGRTFQVYTIRPDGSELAQLTFSEGNKSQPRWSPDGSKLLYVANGGRDNFGNDLGLDIWVMNADGSEPTNLTQSLEDDLDPSWSADGEKIAFTTTRAAGGLRQIFIMNADGSDQSFITRGFGVEFAPTWSPDGEWLAFAISIRGAPPRLYLRTGEGVDPREFDLSKRLGQIDRPDWSPDGLTIVYTCVKPGQNEICLVVVDSKGAEIFQLTNTLGNKEASWSPDGRWIVFTSTRDLNSEIYIMDSLGRNPVNITNNEATDREPSWQPIPIQ